jgi:hypothetical protein
MGRFLVIGIATRMVADKEECEKAFKGVDGLKAAMEQQFNSKGIYQMNETESKVILELKPEVAEKEWIDFIRAFYDIRYIDYEEQDDVFEELSQKNNLKDWLEIAERKEFEGYQATRFYYFPMDSPSAFYDAYVRMDMVILSLDGKIMMECYDGLFSFFTRLIREKLSSYRLADSLFVDITE